MWFCVHVSGRVCMFYGVRVCAYVWSYRTVCIHVDNGNGTWHRCVCMSVRVCVCDCVHVYMCVRAGYMACVYGHTCGQLWVHWHA
jgi:hypothetical protein